MPVTPRSDRTAFSSRALDPPKSAPDRERDNRDDRPTDSYRHRHAPDITHEPGQRRADRR